MTDIDIDRMVNGYLQCALFTGTTDDDEPLDYTYSIEDFEDSAVKLAITECVAFVGANREDVEFLLGGAHLSPVENEDIGIDLWFTQNGHGCGFWDRGYGELGERLQEYCRNLPERNVFAPETDEYEYGPSLVIE